MGFAAWAGAAGLAGGVGRKPGRLMERLEDRVVFDAVPDAPVAVTPQEMPVEMAPESPTGEWAAAELASAGLADESAPANLVDSVATRHELVVVDTSVQDYEQLVALLQEPRDGVDVDVVLVDSNEDGIERLREALAGYQDLDAIHILSHGTERGLRLGNVWLSEDNVAAYAGDLAAWGGALKADADLLLYGCDLAASESGRALLESLAALTGADVAASVDDTGHTARGGDWELEHELGSIETVLPFGAGLQDWSSLLTVSASVTRTSTSVFYIDHGFGNVAAYASYAVENTGTTTIDAWAEITGFVDEFGATSVVGLAPLERGTMYLGSLAPGETATAFFYLQVVDLNGDNVFATTTDQRHTINVYDGAVLPANLVTNQTVAFTAVEETIAANANKVNAAVAGPNPAELGGIMTLTVTGETGTIGASRILAFSPATFTDWNANAYELVGSTITLSGGNTGVVTDELLYIAPSSVNTSYTAVYTFVARETTAQPQTLSPVNYFASGTQIKHTSSGDITALAPILAIENKTYLTGSVTPSTLPSSGGTASYTVTLHNTGSVNVTFDDLVVTLPTTPGSPSYVAGSSTYGGSAIANPTIAGSQLTWSGAWVVPAGGTVNLTFQLNLPATTGTYVTSAVAHIGTMQIDTTTSTADNAPATMSVAVLPPNVPPVVTSLIPDRASVDDEIVSFSIASHFSDPNSNPLTYSATGLPSGVSINLSTGLISGRLAANASQSGPYNVTVTANDGLGGTVSDTFVWTVTNPPPVANDDAFTTPAGTPLSNTVTGGDSDPDGDPLTFSLVDGVDHGTLTLNPNGSFTYTPDAGYVGGDAFVYRVSDGNGGTDTANVTINVVNAPPTVVAPLADRTNFDDDTVSVDISSAFDDPDGHALTFSATGLPPGLNLNTGTGEISGTLPANASQGGPYTVTITADDGFGGMVSDTFLWTVNNPPPNAVDDPFTIDEDTSLNDTVTSNDADPDGDALTYALVSGPADGVLLFQPDGSFTYTPDADFHGTDAFVYLVNDGEGGTDTATVNITVNSVNDPPTLSAPLDDRTDRDGEAVSVDVSGHFDDPEGDTLTFSATGLPPGLAIDADTGEISGMLLADASQGGPYTVTVTADDGNGGTVSATFVWTIDNPPPDAVDDSFTTGEATPLSDSVDGNDEDPDGDSLTYALVSGPADGLLTFAADGSFTYTPDAGFSGTDTFFYSVDDGEGGTDTATVTITVSDGNDPPDAVDDAFTTSEDVPVTDTVASNDSDPDDDPLTYTLVSGPANGTLSLNPDGTFTYTPDANSSGVDTFVYSVDDGQGGTDTATASVTVVPQNDAPDAVDDATTTPEDTSVVVPVLDNDSDIEGDEFAVVFVTQPVNGTVSINPDGTLTYVPNANFTGVETFIYRVQDDGSPNQTAQATVTVTVTPVNDDPTARDDLAATSEDTPVNIAVLANDTDPEGNALTVSAVSLPANGSVTIEADGTITYTPNLNFNGTDSFTYTIDDGNGGTATATVSVTVTGTADAPVAVDDTATTDEDQPVTIDVLANDTDPDDDVLSVTAVGQPAHGTVVLNPDGTVTYTPDADYSGTDTFVYQIEDTDGGSSSATVTVTVQPQNDPPIARDDTLTTDEDTPAVIDVLVNDSDPDNDPIRVTSVTQPLHGTATINPDGTITYVPDANYFGTDSFQYTITDDISGTSTANVAAIQVNPVNDPPVVSTPIADRTDNDDDLVTLDVSGSFGDPDGDTLQFSATGLPPGLTIDPDSGVISGRLPANASQGGPYSVTVTADDGNGGTVSDTFVWTVNNPPPTAGDDAFTTDEDTPLSDTVDANDSDPDGDSLAFSLVSGPANGTLTFDPDGSFTYTPDADFFGSDLFVYSVSDGEGGTATATVNLTVRSVNDDPTVDTPIADQTDNDDDLVTLDVSGTFVDPDGDTLRFSATGLPPGLTIDPDSGLISGRLLPGASQGGPYSVTVTADDGNGGTVSTTFVWTVNNPPPTAGDDAFTTDEDTPLSDTIDANDSDPDGDSLAFSLVSGPANGTLTFDPDGSFTYAPDTDFFGSDSFVYSVSDGEGGTATATVNLTVRSVNDDPTVDTPIADQTDDDDDLVTLDVSGTFVDPDGDTLRFSATGLPPGLTIDPDSGLISGRLLANASQGGPYSVTVTVDDGNGGTASSTFVWNVNNPPPTAGDDAFTTDEDTPFSDTVDANDSDPDGDSLAFSLVSGPANGTLTFDPDGSFTYTPDADFFGSDSFVYSLSDGEGGTATATVNLTVTSVNDDPTVDTPIADQTDDDGDSVTLDLSGTFVDPDGDTLRFSATGLPPGLTIDPDTGVISGRLLPGASVGGPYAVSISVDDGRGGTQTATFVWTVNNPPPTADDDLLVTDEESTQSGDVVLNDADPDGDVLFVTRLNGSSFTPGTPFGLPSGARVTFQSDGTFVYDPNGQFAVLADGETALDSFTYTISDGIDEVTATVSVTIHGLAPDLSIAKDDGGATAEPGETLVYTLTYANVGTQAATGVVLREFPPAGATFDSAASTAGWVDEGDGSFTFDLGSVLPGDQGQILFAVTIGSLADGQTTVVNQATIADDGTHGPESPGNSQVSISTPVEGDPNYEIAITDSVTQAQNGQALTYVITLRNVGDQMGTNVVVENVFPADVLKNVSAGQGGMVNSSGAIVWYLGDVAAGETIELTVTAEVDTRYEPTLTSFTHLTSVNDAGGYGGTGSCVASDTDRLLGFGFDSLHNAADERWGLLPPSVPPLVTKLAPLPVNPIFSGIVEPGTVLVGRIFDERGNVIGERQVVADSAGNWLMTFPSSIIFEHPHHMEITQTRALYNTDHDTALNLRRYFHPAIHTSIFFTENLTIGAALQSRASQTLSLLHAGNTRPLGFAWYAHTYELNIASSNTGQR